MTYDPRALRAFADAIRPPERISPSEFAAKYRYLKPGTTHTPGRWSNSVYPYLTGVMDAVEEAIRLGKRGVVLMKSGQGGGSEAMINVLAWLRTRYSGPMLYLISKDEIAREFGRDRFSYLDESCPPMKALALTGRANGELIHVKRYTNGKIAIQGGRSVLNLQSSPYRFVIIDEYDSMLDEIQGHGDPLALAEIRTDAFPGDTLIIAFAHPSTKDRGAGKLYYEKSDQRRGHVTCPHCSASIWLSWDDVKVIPEGDESQAAAAQIPERYTWVTPCCGCELTDGQRYAACRNVPQVSTLPPEEAARKSWIGVHFSQCYMSNKPLLTLAEHWIEGLEDPGKMRVFVNKRLGDTYEHAVQEVAADDLRACVGVSRHVGDPWSYTLGTVPPMVRFLTAGQDSRATELHYTVWGWGLVEDDAGQKVLCGWLIDAGVVKREKTETLEAADFAPFDEILYSREWPRSDGSGSLRIEQCYHDSGWQPLGVYEYCRKRPSRAIPFKGASTDSASQLPVHRWGAPVRYRYQGREVSDPRVRVALVNTYRVKERLYGLIQRRFRDRSGAERTRIVIPQDAPEDWIEQSSCEYLAQDKRGVYVWMKKRKANHYGDGNVMAFAAALNLNPFQRGRTREQVGKEKQQGVERKRGRKAYGRGTKPKRRVRRRY